MPSDDEALREALIELSLLREREAAALRESDALLAALGAIRNAASPSDALLELLRSVAAHLRCETAAILSGKPEAARITASTDAQLAQSPFPGALLKQNRGLRANDVAQLPWWGVTPDAAAGFRSALSVPIELSEGHPSAILCFSERPDAFSPADRKLLTRLAVVAAQALESLALAERNKLLARVIDGASFGIAIADASVAPTPLVYVNAAFEALSGYKAEEVLGENCRFLSAEPPGSPQRAALRQCVQKRAPASFTLRNRRKDGTLFLNQLSLFPIGDDADEKRYLVATQQDVTAERRAAVERDAARARLSAALSAISQGFLLLDADGVIVFANQRFREFFDIGPANFLSGLSFRRIWSERLEELGRPPASAREMALARQRLLLAGGEEREEKLPDGRVVLVEDRGTPDGGAVCLVTDVTSAKATEQILAQRAAAIDATQDGVAVTDQEGRFVYMNLSHLRMFGYEDEAEVLGSHWRTLYTAEQAARIEQEAMPALERDHSWRGEISGLSRNGETVPQEVSLTLLRGIGLVCVTRDITERQHSERERARLHDQLQSAQRQEAIGQLAAGVAHDFNNLLSVISTLAILLEPKVEGDEEGVEHLQRISAATSRAGDLVSRLLDLGGRAPSIRRLDLREVLRESEALLRAGVPSRIRLEADLPDAPVLLDADQTDVLQILLNLGINARDAFGPDLDKAGGEIRLTLFETDGAAPEGAKLVLGRLDPDRRYAALCVADTGVGMDPEKSKHIFKPYFTTKGLEGTGLGLAVVGSIIARIGGAICLRTQIGRGATFCVYWPLDAATAAASDLAGDGDGDGDSRVCPGAIAALKGAPVLVCDDIPEVGQGLAKLLEQVGAEVAICEDPRDALQAIEEDPQSWRLLITDYDMPHMTGRDLAAAARAAAPSMPIILFSALAEARRPSELFDATLGKPLSAPKLWSAIAKALLSRDQVKR